MPLSVPQAILNGPNEGRNTHASEVNGVTSGQTFKRGAPLIATAGLLVQASEGPTVGIVGFAAANALNPDGVQSRENIDGVARYTPADGEVFEATFATSSGGSLTAPVQVALAQTDLFGVYGLSKFGSYGPWYVNKALTGAAGCVVIVGFKDAVGVNDARVYFKVKGSALAIA
jgi:hypothetical protein